MKPEDLLYSKDHEWVAVETDAAGAKIATVGISAFALEALTDLVYIELPEVGRRVEAGAPIGVIESVKAVSDLFCPVEGEVVEVNLAWNDNLEGLADDPYESGWLVKVKLSDESSLEGLFDYAAYQKQCEEELADE